MEMSYWSVMTAEKNLTKIKLLLSLFIFSGCASSSLEVNCVHMHESAYRTIIYCGPLVRCEKVESSRGLIKMCEIPHQRKSRIVTVNSDTI
jgi:hypothetical protein